MKLYLVRHGESEGNVDRGYISGRTDTRGLTTKGKAQITRTAWELRGEKFEHVISSPVVRAHETAEILGRLLRAPVTHELFLEEMSYGDYEGEYFWVNLEQKRADFERWSTEFDFAFPNGESLQMVSDRVWKGYTDWVASVDPLSPVNILFVSHDVIISTLLFCLMYGHPSAETATASYKKAFMQFVHNIEVPNGSIYVVDLAASPLRFTLREPESAQVPVESEAIAFYLRGVGGFNDVSLEEKITASENIVYHVSNGSDAIIKIIREREIVSSERIVSIYEYLKKNTDIDAPDVICYDKSRVFFRDTVLLQDYKDGQDQNQHFENRLKCGKDIIERTFALAGRIHSIPVSDVAEFWYPEDAWHKVHIPWSAYIEGELSATLARLPEVLPDEAMRRKIDAELQLLGCYVASEDYKLVPIHGDFAPQNIVVTVNGLLRVLDFERARIGDPLWDLAYYYGWLQRKNRDLGACWDGLVRKSLDAEAFLQYRRFALLFHAWTLRDTLEYASSPLRAEHAKASLNVLQSLDWR